MEAGASGGDSRGPGTESTELSVECPFPTSLYQTVASHGWVHLAPWEWDEDARTLSRMERFDAGPALRVEVSQPAPRRLTITPEGAGTAQVERHKIASVVRRWLSLDWDPQPAIDRAAGIDPAIAGFIREGGGRFLRCSSLYEDYVKTVCTINANWGATMRMVSRLVDDLGRGVFPSPVQVLDCGETRLRRELRIGFRSRVLIESTRQMLDHGVIDERGHIAGPGISYDYLLGLRGVGPYSAGHVAMLLGDFSRVPVDSEVASYCKETYGLEPDEVGPFFDQWGEFRFLGYKLGRILRGSG